MLWTPFMWNSCDSSFPVLFVVKFLSHKTYFHQNLSFNQTFVVSHAKFWMICACSCSFTWVSCIVVTCCMWCLGPSNEMVNVSYQEESWFVLLQKFDKNSALDKLIFAWQNFYNRSCRLAIVEKVFRLMMILKNTLRRSIRWYGLVWAD